MREYLMSLIEVSLNWPGLSLYQWAYINCLEPGQFTLRIVSNYSFLVIRFYQKKIKGDILSKRFSNNNLFYVDMRLYGFNRRNYMYV